MHPNLDVFYNSKLGMIFGFLGFIIKSIMLAQENEASLLSAQNIFESSVIAVICTLIGLAVTSLVNWIKKKWLGRKI